MEFKVNLSRPDITEAEIKAVTDVLRTPNLSLGPKLGEFEEAFCDYIGKKRGIAVNSGTSALFLCLKAMGIGPEGVEIPDGILSSLNGQGLSRVCDVGGMQRPPLDWTHDGHPFFPVAGPGVKYIEQNI